jgi:hypothetical protein
VRETGALNGGMTAAMERALLRSSARCPCFSASSATPWRDLFVINFREAALNVAALSAVFVLEGSEAIV